MRRRHTMERHCFDIIGPVMVGPSSSHTAGAVRLGRVARALAGQQPARVVISLHGSFAQTHRGHGTDRALLAGLLGMAEDDVRIPISPELCQQAGLAYSFVPINLPGAHPNTAVIDMWCPDGQQTTVRGASTGGGQIRIEAINGLEVSFSGAYSTLVIRHQDSPGAINRVTRKLADRSINIATMKVFRAHRGGMAVMIIETDQMLDAGLCEQIKRLTGIQDAIWIEPIQV